MMRVRLDWSEMEIAATVGKMRQMQALELNRAARYGASVENAWTLNMEGAAGEMAVAKALGIYWSGNIGNLGAADVGPMQVRTSSRSDGDLILHPRDRDDAIFVLATGLAPSFRIVGWLYAVTGKDDKYWRDPAGGRPAYFVPQRLLRPMYEIMAGAGRPPVVGSMITALGEAEAAQRSPERNGGGIVQ